MYLDCKLTVLHLFQDSQSLKFHMSYRGISENSVNVLSVNRLFTYPMLNRSDIYFSPIWTYFITYFRESWHKDHNDGQQTCQLNVEIFPFRHNISSCHLSVLGENFCCRHHVQGGHHQINTCKCFAKGQFSESRCANPNEKSKKNPLNFLRIYPSFDYKPISDVRRVQHGHLHQGSRWLRSLSYWKISLNITVESI